MQKSRPTTAGRVSRDHHEVTNSYADGFSAGFEAGRRISLVEGTQLFNRRRGDDMHQYRSTSQRRRPFASARRTPPQTNRDQRFNPEQINNIGPPPLGEQLHNRERGMAGQITNPSGTIHLQAHGHY
ncbi:unnamed protein product [Adineta ricciae]|uniref:Uncharacterized protein n=1 Tax=Adineta ricciae TaxID=249248 RepID=A0A814HXM2_ADIRI|nr:unnamed protein product [Adineta ricciae]